MKITLPTALLTLFIALKLCHVIEWSWLWVLSPLWMPLAVACILAVALLTVTALCTVFVLIFDRRPTRKAKRL